MSDPADQGDGDSGGSNSPESLPCRLKLSLCMIVRDSSSVLESALTSIRPWVDEMIVVDTGSIDDTPALAARLGARVFHFPWCDDFSAARNESILHASGEWIFWMDSDDTIDAENGRRLRESVDALSAAGSVLGLVAKVRCPANGTGEGYTEVDHIKLFRNRPDLRFEGRIHEQILPAIRKAGGEVDWTELFVVHSGTDQTPEGRRRKCARDLRILKLEDSERPDRTFTLFNLGMTYCEAGEYLCAVECLQRSLFLAEPGESHVRKAYAILAGALALLRRDYDAIAVCKRGLTACPNDPELLFRIGILYQNAGQLQQAEAAYIAVLREPHDRHFSSVDSGIGSYKARHNLALVYMSTHRLGEAEDQWRKVSREMPDFAPARRGLYECLLRQGKWNAAGIELLSIRAHRDLSSVLLQIRCDLTCAAGDIEGAISLLREALAAAPQDIDSILTLAQLLFESGALDDAAAALTRVTSLRPHDPLVLYNLALTLSKLGKHHEAISYCRQSLELRPNHHGTLSLVAICEEAAMTSRGKRDREGHFEKSEGIG
jgi:O-antigen biosynthesis protein